MRRALGAVAEAPVVSLEHIEKRFGGVVALKEVDFQAYPGEVHGLIGQNGAGKSTLMRILAGSEVRYQGTYRLSGTPIRLRDPLDARKRGITMVHQELSVIPPLSVAENIFLNRYPRRWGRAVDWRTIRRQAADYLETLGMDVDVTLPLDRYPYGVRQMVEVAKAAFGGARVLVLDEPTSALSANETGRLFELVEALRTKGVAVIFVSHILDDVVEISDRVTVLRDGVRVFTGRRGEYTKDQLVDEMLGSQEHRAEGGLTLAKDLPPEPDTPVRFEVRGLTRQPYFRDVSFAIHQGEILGLFGPMGAGHEDLGRTVYGLLPADSGQIVLDGRMVAPKSAVQAKRLGIAYLPETRHHSLVSRAPIFKNVSLAHLAAFTRPRSRFVIDGRAEAQAAADQASRLNVRMRRLSDPVDSLSGGNQQKVALSKWLVRPPELMILDEPFRGIDIGAKIEIARHIRSLRDGGVTVLVLSKEPETIIELCDRVLVFRRGQCVASLAGTHISKNILMKV